MAKDTKGTSQPAQAGQSPQPQGSVNKKPKKNGVLFGVIAFLTAIIIIFAVFGGAFYIIVHNNVNGIGEKYRSNIQQFSFLRWALPTVVDPEDPKYLTAEQIKTKYVELRKKNEELAKQLDVANNQIKELQKLKDEQDKQKAENEKIKNEASDKEKAIADKEKKLSEDQKKLNELIAKGDKAGFKAFFEKIDKETAQKIYSDIIKEQKATDDVKELAQIYESMEPSATAAIFNQMGNSKMDLIVAAIKNMKKEVSAEVLAAMDPALAAKISEKISNPAKSN